MKELTYVGQPEWKSDIQRMRSILNKENFDASEHDISHVWSNYSSKLSDKWKSPPEEDSEILQILLEGFLAQ